MNQSEVLKNHYKKLSEFSLDSPYLTQDFWSKIHFFLDEPQIIDQKLVATSSQTIRFKLLSLPEMNENIF